MRRRSLLVAMVLCLQVLVSTPLPARAVGPAKPYDFNGDGYADLAIGVPGDRVGRKDQAGAVNVLYGSKKGLTATKAQLWSQGTPGIKGKPSSWESFGSVVGSGDFDCDGYADMAVSNQYVHPQVAVLYGSRRGLTSRDQLLGVTSSQYVYAEPVQYLAAGDFDHDGCDQLAFTTSGSIIVYHGSPRGLRRQWELPTPTVIAESGAPRFGQGLVTGDLTGDGIADLVAGGAVVSAGTRSTEGVAVIPGSSRGLLPSRMQRLSAPSSIDSSDTPFFSYAYGSSMAIGDFDGDRRADLAVGDGRAGREPSEGPPWCPGADFCSGAVVVHHGTRSGLPTSPDLILTTSRLGRLQRTGFGSALAAGDTDGDGRSELAVLQRWSVVIFPGGPRGLTTADARLWDLGSPGVKGRPFRSTFGFGCGGIRLLDHGDGKRADLSIGTPEYHGGRGAVSVLYGSARGVTARGDQLWSQGSRGVPGRPEGFDDTGGPGDLFGGSRSCSWDMF